MIEMIYPGDKKEEKKLPKNVRQIGEPGNGKKVYLEDYALTYLHKVEGAVLLGESQVHGESRYIFIYGAIGIPDLNFKEDTWEKVRKEAKEHFPDCQIMGWMSREEELPYVCGESQETIFREHFHKEDTVLLLYEPGEKEDMLFVEEQGTLQPQGGYYVYYDRNPAMEAYLIQENQGRSLEKEEPVSDRAIKVFRKMTENKKEGVPNVRFLYGASTFLAFTILAIGAIMVGNYDKMKQMETALSNMAQQTEAAVVSADAAKEQESETESEENWIEELLTEEAERASEEETALPDTEGVEEDSKTSGENILWEEKEWDSEEEVTEATTEGAENSSVQTAGTVRNYQASYTVKIGDTLADICRTYYGTDEKLEELCEINEITDPNRIFPGQTLRLP